jgi:hypothetical protein
MSPLARTGIRQEYDATIEESRKKVAEMLERPDVKFSPNFETTFEKLREASKVKGSSVRDDWEKQLGYLTRLYFEGLVSQMSYQKFGDDELLREGFNEAVESGEVAFRVVDKLKYDTYCEVVLEDGVLYLQVRVEMSLGGYAPKTNLLLSVCPSRSAPMSTMLRRSSWISCRTAKRRSDSPAWWASFVASSKGGHPRMYMSVIESRYLDRARGRGPPKVPHFKILLVSLW